MTIQVSVRVEGVDDELVKEFASQGAATRFVRQWTNNTTDDQLAPVYVRRAMNTRTEQFICDEDSGTIIVIGRIWE